MYENPDRQHLIDIGLERAAETLGDITGPVMAEFYRHYPEARHAFEQHATELPGQLEAEMVGIALYHAMEWFKSPMYTEIVFNSSVRHHEVALHVPADWYRGLIEAFFAVVGPAACTADKDERAAWQELREGLVGLVERNRSGA